MEAGERQSGFLNVGAGDGTLQPLGTAQQFERQALNTAHATSHDWQESVFTYGEALYGPSHFRVVRQRMGLGSRGAVRGFANLWSIFSITAGVVLGAGCVRGSSSACTQSRRGAAGSRVAKHHQGSPRYSAVVTGV